MTGNNLSLFKRAGFIGFDHILNELDQISNHALDHYPPHNIVKYDENEYSIEIAIAGFSKEEIMCEIKDGVLTVSGEHKTKGREYIHKGISTRRFTRQFRLSEHTQVGGAVFKDGLLVINLKVVVPEEQRPRLIDIK